jgi:hypothetical protein
MDKSRRDLQEEIYCKLYGGGSTELMDLQIIKFISSALAQLFKTETNHALIYLSQ